MVGTPEPTYTPRPAVELARNAAIPPAAGAVALSAVTLPVAESEATEVAAPKVPVTVTAPVVALIEIVWKPFSERTGPENVVLAIIFLRVVALVRTVSTKSAGPVGTNIVP
jgi:hypothetical protein